MNAFGSRSVAKRPPLAEDVLRELLALPNQELLAMLVEYWGVPLDEVYAEWKTTEKGCFFGDFRNADGQSLWLPQGAGPASAKLLGNPAVPLAPNQYYKLSLQLAGRQLRERIGKPFALETAAASVVEVDASLQGVLSLMQKRDGQLVPPAERAQRKQEVEAALAERTDMGTWAAGAMTRMLAKITARLATATDRMFWELLQNADDKPHKGGHEPRVTFELLPNYLLFLHNGEPFSQADMRGISDAADGTKEDEEDMTGYKGIGFKSVFATSRAVYLHSGGYSFRFAPEAGEDPTKVPWMIWPRWTELKQFPPELLAHDPYFQSVASSVAIALEVGSEQIQQYATLLPTTFATPVFLLFLRSVRSVRLNGLAAPLLLRRQDVANHVVELWNNNHKTTYRRQDFWVNVSDAQREAAQQDEFMPDSLKRATQLKLTLAIPLTDAGPVAVASDDAVLYCYLPTTDDHYLLPALVNADFLTDPSREKVLPEKLWNNYLFEALGETWPRWLAAMLTQEPNWAGAIYKLLPVCYEGKNNANQSAFNEGLKRAITSTEFILTVTDELIVPAAAVLDEAGLAGVLPELYAAHLTEELKLMHPTIVLTGPQQKLLGLKKITQAAVLALLGQPATAAAYPPERAVALLYHSYQSQDVTLLAALKNKPWLLDQQDKALAPSAPGCFGVVGEEPDEDFPLNGQLRYLHPTLQAALRTDTDLRAWFEQEFGGLPPLTREAALARLGSRLAAGQVTNEEATAVAAYLFGLHGKKELSKVGDKKALSKLPVLDKKGVWRPVAQLYVGDYYQPSYRFETLAAEMGGQFAFIAEGYGAASGAAEWGKFWGELGAKRPAQTELFQNDLLPLLAAGKLSEAGHDALFRFALRLYSESRPGELVAEWPKLGALRLCTLGQGRQALSVCMVGDTYPARAEVAGRLLPQGLPTQLAPGYADELRGKPGVVREFLVAAAGRVATPAEGFTALALAHLAGAGAPATLAESVRVVRELAALVSESKLASELKLKLSSLPLYLKNGHQQPAGRCYLGTEYAPKLDIEQLTSGTEKAVLDGCYQAGAANPAGVRALLTGWLGVREQFEPEWHMSVNGSKGTLPLLLQPHWEYVNTRNTGLGNQLVTFTNVLVVNNLELVKSAEVAEQLAKTLAGAWAGKPEAFGTCAYQISCKTRYEMSPWAGPSKFYLRGPAGKQPQVGERYLSKRLEATSPKSAWVAMHTWGSLELERYLGLRTELSLAEELQSFSERSEKLRAAPLTTATLAEFEKLVAPLLAHFQEKVEDTTLPAWRAKLHWPAADGSWQPISELHWLGADAKRYYDGNRAQLVRRIPDSNIKLSNFCLALKVSVVNASDFKPIPPANGGQVHTATVQQRATTNHLLRLVVHRQFGYDNPTALAFFQQHLEKLSFIEVPVIQLECSRIPGFVVPVEGGYLADEPRGIFYFRGGLFTRWQHLNALGGFLEKMLVVNAPGQVLIELLRATTPAELRDCLQDAGWPIPDWLPEPALGPARPHAPTSTNRPSSPAAPDQEDPEREAEPARPDGWGDGGAHALYNPGVPADKRRDYQREAREAAVKWLRQPQQGYTVADEAHDGYSTLGPVKKGDTMWRVVVKSYRGGILYLNPNEWLTLAGDNSFLLLYKPGTADGGMEKIDSLHIAHGRNRNIIVRMENQDAWASIPHLTQLAEMHQHSGSFKFIFDSPSNRDFDFELTGNHTATGPLPEDDPDTNLF